MKIALTGGSTGIGAQVAQKLTAAGHEVTAFDIAQPSDHIARYVKLDLSDPSSIDAALAAAEGPYDVLINNAGLPPKEGLAELVLAVNYTGFKMFLDGMLDKLSDGASIVNVASRAGAMWRDNLAQVKALSGLSHAELGAFIDAENMDATRAYNLSKEAVIVSTIAMCEDMINKGFRINSVSPAAVNTGILDDFVSAFGPKVAANIKRVGRPGEPSEVADVILYLASPQSNWIKGQDIVIDGGMGACGMTDMMGLK